MFWYKFMVAVAQLAERLAVAEVVARSNRVGHPTQKEKRSLAPFFHLLLFIFFLLA